MPLNATCFSYCSGNASSFVRILAKEKKIVRQLQLLTPRWRGRQHQHKNIDTAVSKLQLLLIAIYFLPTIK
jgi:hypothetical protein